MICIQGGLFLFSMSRDRVVPAGGAAACQVAGSHREQCLIPGPPQPGGSFRVRRGTLTPHLSPSLDLSLGL